MAYRVLAVYQPGVVSLCDYVCSSVGPFGGAMVRMEQKVDFTELSPDGRHVIHATVRGAVFCMNAQTAEVEQIASAADGVRVVMMAVSISHVGLLERRSATLLDLAGVKRFIVIADVPASFVTIALPASGAWIGLESVESDGAGKETLQKWTAELPVVVASDPVRIMVATRGVQRKTDTAFIGRTTKWPPLHIRACSNSDGSIRVYCKGDTVCVVENGTERILKAPNTFEQRIDVAITPDNAYFMLTYAFSGTFVTQMHLLSTGTLVNVCMCPGAPRIIFSALTIPPEAMIPRDSALRRLAPIFVRPASAMATVDEASPETSLSDVFPPIGIDFDEAEIARIIGLVAEGDSCQEADEQEEQILPQRHFAQFAEEIKTLYWRPRTPTRGFIRIRSARDLPRKRINVEKVTFRSALNPSMNMGPAAVPYMRKPTVYPIPALDDDDEEEETLTHVRPVSMRPIRKPQRFVQLVEA